MNKTLIFVALFMLLLGISAGYWFANNNQHTMTDTNASKTVDEPLFYRNPMNPEITSPVPTEDDMGMAYIPVYADDGAQSNDPIGTVTIDPVVTQNMGVRTALVKKDILSHIVRAVGRVAYDEERIVRLHPKVEGWIETLRVDKTGEKVKFNQDLLSIYSPQLARIYSSVK